MKSYKSNDNIIVRLDTGDDVLRAVKRVCQEQRVNTGAVVSAIGTLQQLRIHYLHTDDLNKPKSERNTVFQSNDCWEVSGIQGLIVDSDPHLHVTAYNGEQTVSGHLEEGCTINALGEILIQRMDGFDLERQPNKFDISTLNQNDSL